MIPLTDTSYSALSKAGEWFPVMDLYSNAFFAWRNNPLIALLASGSPFFYALLLSVTTAVAFAAYGRLFAMRTLHGVIASFIFLSAIVLYLGINIPALSFACALSITLYAYQAVLSEKITHTRAGLLLAFAACTAWTLSPIIAFSLVPLFFRASRSRSRFITASVLSLLAIALFHGSVSFPDYPLLARFTRGYQTAIGVDPLIGRTHLIPSIDRDFTQGTLIAPAAALCFLSLACLLSGAGSLAAMAFLLSCSVLWDSRLWDPLIRVTSPVQAVARVVPGLISFPVGVYFLISALCLVTTSALSLRSRRLFPFAAIVAFLIVVAARPPREWILTNAYLGTPEFPVKLIESPSLFLLRNETAALRDILPENSIAPSALGATVRASKNQKRLKNLQTPELTDRWSTGFRQSGGEWLEIVFKTPVDLRGVDVSVRNHFTDYPRGLEVTIGADTGQECSRDLTVYSQEPFLGSVARTPDGYPYYTTESTVRIPFEKVTTSCLRITQTGRSETFDWSVEQIGLYQ